MLASCFVLSLAHELVMYYMTLEATCEMIAFFTLQGLVIGMETTLKVHCL
jgi:hypothetical protein